jgi:hypothetical protein
MPVRRGNEAARWFNAGSPPTLRIISLALRATAVVPATHPARLRLEVAQRGVHGLLVRFNQRARKSLVGSNAAVFDRGPRAASASPVTGCLPSIIAFNCSQLTSPERPSRRAPRPTHRPGVSPRPA